MNLPQLASPSFFHSTDKQLHNRLKIGTINIERKTKVITDDKIASSLYARLYGYEMYCVIDASISASVLYVNLPP